VFSFKFRWTQQHKDNKESIPSALDAILMYFFELLIQCNPINRC